MERWFGLLTERQIKRGAHKSVHALEKAIEDYLQANNEEPKPFAWTKTADEILAPDFETGDISTTKGCADESWNVIFTGDFGSCSRTFGSDAAKGQAYARCTIKPNMSGEWWQFALVYLRVPIETDKSYTLEFSARASSARVMRAVLQKCDGGIGYGLSSDVTMNGDWKRFSLPFKATSTDSAAKLLFGLNPSMGGGSVDIDDVKLYRTP